VFVCCDVPPPEGCQFLFEYWAWRFLKLAISLFLHTSRRCGYFLIRTQCPHGLHSLVMVLIEFTMIVVEAADLPASEVSLSVGDSVPMTLTSSPR
jgi:hypothetical protein